MYFQVYLRDCFFKAVSSAVDAFLHRRTVLLVLWEIYGFCEKGRGWGVIGLVSFYLGENHRNLLDSLILFHRSPLEPESSVSMRC